MKHKFTQIIHYASIAGVLLLSACNSGTNSSSSTPTMVKATEANAMTKNIARSLKNTSSGTSIKFKQVVAGISSFCALDQNGEILCWGSNGSGQLGNGTTKDAYFATKVSNPDNVVFNSLVGFNYNYCATDTNNILYCWGGGGSGQIGDGLNKNALIPTKVQLPVDSVTHTAITFTSISVGASTICGVGTNKHIYCWGDNQYGQVGNGTNTNATTPTQIVMADSNAQSETFVEVNINYYGSGAVCALASSGNIYCWGGGGNYALGNGTTADSNKAILVKMPANGDKFKHLVQGMGNGNCALTTLDTAYCWGYNNSGEGGNGISYLPVQVPTAVIMPVGETFTTMSTSVNTACAITNLGNAYCWGYGYTGQRGDGSNSNLNVPVKLQFPSQVLSISSSYYQSATLCALDINHKVYCWGAGNYGSVGNGESYSVNVPTPIAMFDSNTNFMQAAISGNSNTSCAVEAQGDIYCWGYGLNGQLGNGNNTNSYIPTRVVIESSESLITDLITTRGFFANTFCALHSSNQVYCWGYGIDGEIGNGRNLSESTPQSVLLPEDVSITQLVAANETICGIDTNGYAYCWGSGEDGQIGNGTMQSSNIPQKVAPPDGSAVPLSFTQLVAASETFCGLDKNSLIYCWGYGLNGQIGNMAKNNVALPTPVGGNIKFNMLLGAGNDTFCAQSTSNYVYCWGKNTHGVAGIGSTQTEVTVPTQIAMAQGKYVKLNALTATNGNFCGFDSNYIYCWGLGSSGQIGNGLTNDQTGPAQIAYAYVPLSLPTQIIGNEYSLCTLINSRAYCWGYGIDGEMGNNTTAQKNPYAKVVTMPTNGDLFKSVSATSNSFCALSTNGLIYCWGSGWYGQMGNNNDSNNLTPSMVSYANQTFAKDTAPITKIVGAADTFCALNSQGHIYCWGYGLNGETAQGVNQNTESPTPIMFNY